MNAISQNLSLLKDFTGFSMDQGKFYAAQLSQVTTSQEESKDITILTEEGDKVTISADSQRNSQYTTYSGLVRANGVYASLQGKSLAMDSSMEFSMAVEGDLNEQEMKDIRKAIKAIDKIMHSALSGDMGNALAMVNEVGNLESISSFEASMESKKTVVMEQAIMMVAEGAAEPTEENAEENAVIGSPIKPATDQIMDIVQNSGVKPAKFDKPFKRYLSNLFDRFSKEDHEHHKRHEIGRRMKSELLERIRQWREEKEKEQETPETGSINNEPLEMNENTTPPPEVPTDIDPKPEPDTASSTMEA
jgi:hypothetical protein